MEQRGLSGEKRREDRDLAPQLPFLFISWFSYRNMGSITATTAPKIAWCGLLSITQNEANINHQHSMLSTDHAAGYYHNTLREL